MDERVVLSSALLAGVLGTGSMLMIIWLILGVATLPLVPWNSCGPFIGATLGVATLSYVPYAIFCDASPALSVLDRFTGSRIERIGPSHTTIAEEAQP